jgi:hypothetical protein
VKKVRVSKFALIISAGTPNNIIDDSEKRYSLAGTYGLGQLANILDTLGPVLPS